MIRINDSKPKTTLKAAVLVSALLLFAAATGFGQQVVNVTAGPATTTLPDGTTLPMWGYSCGAAVSTSTATCTSLSGSTSDAATGALGGIYVLNGGSGYSSTTPPTVTITPVTGNTPTTPAVATAVISGGQVVGFNVTNHGAGYLGAPTVTFSGGGGTGAVAAAAPAWSPVVITVPFVAGGASLTLNLTNNLSFTPASGGSANNIPTSLVIVGQVGGGLGSSHTTTPSPSHADAQGCPTWFIAYTPTGNPASPLAPTQPGTPCTTSTPLTSPPTQGPRVQSMATEVPAVAAGTVSSTALTWSSLRPGTYLIESGTHPSIQVPMGLIGMLVVTTVPAGTTAGTAYPAVTGSTSAASQALVPAVQYNAEVPLEFSEIDPVQNKAVDLAVRTTGFSETAVWTRMNTGSITSLTLTNAGSGYTSAPIVTFTGGSGAGATATATLGSGVDSVAVTSGGSGYSTPPAVSFAGGGSESATGTAALSFGIANVSVTSGGTGYAAGNTLTFTGTGTTAAGTVSSVALGAAGTVSTITVTAGGSGYDATTTVTLSGGGGTGATATPTVSTAGVITAITVVTPGSGYTSAPTVTFGDTTSTTASGAAATAALGGAITGVTLSANGGYTSAPTVGVTSTGTGAVLAAILATTGSVGSVTVTNGGVYTAAPNVLFSGGGGTGAAATATLALGSLVLTVTNAGGGYTTAPLVSITGGGGTGATATATVGASGCGTAHTCYPPAVNYTPFYYLINGQAFDKTNPGRSLFAATAGTSTVSPITGTLLARLVNAGLRMHVPSIVGSLTQGFSGSGGPATVGGFTLIAEDGNPLPNLLAPRVQTDVFMAAGKTYDVMVNTPAAATTGGTVPSLPIYDRELSLSANSSVRDAGMLAYIGVNGATLPAGLAGAATGTFGLTAAANADTYGSVVPCATGATCISLVVLDPSKGVIANDINVYGVELSTSPANGTLTCNALPGSPVAGICANGTFTYTPSAGMNSTAAAGATFDTFGYCANGAQAGTTGLCTTVTLNVSSLAGNPVANTITYTSKIATFLKIASPGVLSVDSDPNNLPLTVVTTGTSAPTLTGGTLEMDPKGGFTASVSGTGNATCPNTAPTGSNCFSFEYVAQNSQGRQSSPAIVTLVFPPPSNLVVNVLDAAAYSNCKGLSTCIAGLIANKFSDYRWIIEEDKTFWVDPNCTTNSSITTPGCPGIVGPAGQSTIPTFGVQFHTSTMDFVAQGCTGPLSCEAGQTMLNAAGQHVPAVCDLGNGACRPDPNCSTLPCSSGGLTPVDPSQVVLDPSKRYYISVLPGDAANPFPSYLGQPQCPTNGGEANGANYTTNCGHTMSGAPIPPACNILGGPNACTTTSTFASVNVLVLPTPLPTGKLSVMVFEDDFPLNGEQDAGGGIDVLALQEPGLGGFNLVLWDTYGGLGDVTGQDTYDMFNMPLSNSLAGSIDPSTNLDACPISATSTQAPAGVAGGPPAGGITGMIVTCPKFESDGETLSPLAGQAVIANLMPEKFSVQAYPGADRIARGEEWLQTNTLDGQHPHDSFIRIGEPSYFQEYGPAGYHVSIGFANPAIINARHADVCGGVYGAVGACTGTIEGQVDVQRQSRTPDERLYPSGTRDALAWTQCWVSLGDPDAEDFMFTKCDANGNFKFTGVPGGTWRITLGDQWNDQIIDGLSTPAQVAPGQTLNMGNISTQQWQANLYTRTFIDDNKNGIWDSNEIGIPLIYTMIHYRDGHNANVLVTDFNGIANFNETFPLFNWYVVEADSTRYKTTGIHTVYDAGGPADGSPSCGPSNGARACGTSIAYKFLANTFEGVPLPADLSVPGAVYCAKADCMAEATSFAAGTAIASSSTGSTGRIDPPWVIGEGWSGETSQSQWIDFGKAPYASCPPACATVTYTPPGGTATTTKVGENGGITGIVAYSSTRPFDDADQMIQQPWEPNVPHVTVNLYQEGFAADGVTPTLTMVDTTQSASWDDWAQGFYPNYTDPASGTSLPYMNCPGQGTASGTNADLFYFTLFDQPNYLDYYNSIHNGGTLHTLPYNSQYKCYDAMHIWNQLQPAVYDGQYSFPSVLGINPANGKLVSTVGSTNGAPASMAGTNCTVCVANPDSTDKYRFGTPMLPPGKYVAEVVLPPGYEIYKEEDKNLLIGDNFIAPVTQQFGGLGTDIFIIPDQASVASMYDESAAGYNPNNFQDQTTALGLGDELSGVPGFPGYTDPVWPCVGEMRTVPDYLSLYPQAKEVAPFAGAIRPLCDRKEVTLANQMSVNVRFFIFTSTHIASKFTGVITDDFTSEFDPFSPQFGEKFSPPNMPISTRDYLGNEISRVYSDHWGIYDGLTFSSWEVNPPNITGYSPTMMVQCMNDAGPIRDTNPSSPTFGQMINDPLYNPAYSNFCYEEPYMPGLTTYLDTPVVPTSAFAGAGYNNPDCDYPDATPAIKEVDGDGVGPWVSAASTTLTITALGNQTVNNYGYSGPSATTVPFNEKTITRHYGFGTQCQTPTAGSATCNTLSSVTIGGRSAVIDSWSDTQILVTVPTGVPNCAVQQQAQYGGSSAQCGQLLITAGNGKQSIDTVTVTIGGKAPAHVTTGNTIQSAIDSAAPGDLIIINPGTYNELLLMWKPVRLQGVGAASTIINARPVGTLDSWRVRVNCLFGLALNGQPYSTAGNLVPLPGGGGFKPLNVYDPSGALSCPATGWKYFGGGPNNPQVDRLPLEGVLNWDTTVNGNLAELLQEPSLMGAYEGAGITVLGKGVRFPAGLDVFGSGQDTAAGSFIAHESQMPVPTIELTNIDADCNTLETTSPTTGYSSNFQCNPSRIDGLSITNSSQGGGGIFVHAWAHNLEIANNRIYNNAGTVSGGINVGQGESGDALLSGNAGDPVGYNGGVLAGFDQQPWTCVPGAVIYGPNVSPYGYDQVVSPPGTVLGQQLPYCYNLNLNVHNNSISKNSSIGDELFSATPAGGGGVTFCTGSDYYKFNFNWVCGNLSTGDGGGVAHLGFSVNGDIEHNSILFNQSTNPSIPANGGGIVVMPTAPDGFNAAGLECGSVTDVDCAPGVGDGTGPGLMVNANLIMGNAAESGSGGGIAFQGVNGTELTRFPQQPGQWYQVMVTNNIIADNVAGWDGGGISLLDSLNVDIVNNTIVSNVTTASAGPLTNTLGAPLASAVNTTNGCSSNCGTTSPPEPAGVVSIQNSAPLTASLPSTVTIVCPANHFAGNTATNGTCRQVSYPLLANDVIWQNSAYNIGVGGLSSSLQQNVVTLYNAFTTTPAPSQTTTGACVAASYWDLGVRGDTTVHGHESGITLAPAYSDLTDPTGYDPTNISSNPAFVSQYCDGSRQPPELGASGWAVPPGISDATTPNPLFNLTPVATVDEGNNWINMRWGPLSLVNPVTNTILGNYALAAGSPAIDYVPLNSTTLPTSTVPTLSTDFFGNPRPDPGNPNHFDVGAVEFQNTSGTASLTSIAPPNGAQGTVVNVTITGTGLTLASAVNISGSGVTVSNFVGGSATTVTATFTIAAGATISARNVTVTTPPGTSNPVTFSVVAPPPPTLTSILPSSEIRGTAVPVLLTGTNFTAGSNVVISPAATGVSVSAVTVTSPTTITATITSTGTAAVGSVNVGVTTPAGASNTLPFAITGPVLTSIACTPQTPPTPCTGAASANRNSTGVTVVATGSGFTNATSLNFSGNGITVTSFTVNTDSQITATINISTGATAGARNVTVTGVGGTSNAATFTITVPPAGLFGIQPNTGARATTQAVTLTGISFTASPAVTVNVSGGNITVGGVTVVSDTQINANFTIAATAALTARNVSVTVGGVTTTPVTFTVVNPGTPIINTISPASGFRGTPTTVTLSGSNFVVGSTVNVVAPANGLTVTRTTVNVAAQTITATFNTTGGAMIGPRSIKVTTVGGTSNAVTYTVSGPVINNISPTSAYRGTGAAIPVSIYGTGFTAGATPDTVNVPGGGITVGPVTVVGDGQINTTFTIGGGAAGTARAVTVTAPGGVSNSAPFTVLIPGTPTLASVSPATGVRSTTVPVTLTGTNFVVGETTAAVSGAGVTVSGVTVTSPTLATANFAISAGATLGAHNVTVTVAGAAAASNAVPFTVQGASLTSIGPNSGTRGTASLPVTFAGNNLTGATGVNGIGGGTGVSLVAGSLVVVSSTQVNATLAITAAAPGAVLNIGLATPIGNTNTIPFTVQGANVAISAPVPTLAPTTANTGTESATITVTNAAAATAPLTLTANPTVTTVGAAGGTFSITGGTCVSGATVSPGATCTIVVQYVAPVATPQPTATANVTITGTGMATATLTGANFNAN